MTEVKNEGTPRTSGVNWTQLNVSTVKSLNRLRGESYTPIH